MTREKDQQRKIKGDKDSSKFLLGLENKRELNIRRKRKKGRHVMSVEIQTIKNEYVSNR